MTMNVVRPPRASVIRSVPRSANLKYPAIAPPPPERGAVSTAAFTRFGPPSSARAAPGAGHDARLPPTPAAPPGPGTIRASLRGPLARADVVAMVRASTCDFADQIRGRYVAG